MEQDHICISFFADLERLTGPDRDKLYIVARHFGKSRQEHIQQTRILCGG